jgi:intracellular multiplication protein IcmB
VAESIISSIPGLSRGNAATPIPDALSSVTQMLPHSQVASIWEKGSRLFRTEHGKVIPFQPFSSKQSHHTKLVIGPMGFGKSVEMAADNWAFVLHPDNNQLPYISIIDVGPSSRGFIELVRGLLPKNKKHLAVYERPQNTKEYAINIADTLLGLRFPLSNHKATIINFLCSLALPDDLSAPPEGTIDVIERLVTLGYEKLADRRYQLLYEKGVNVVVDNILTELEFQPLSARVSWWDITDFLFANNLQHEASLAQRYAVPDVPYFTSLTNDPRISEEFKDVSTSSGEKITNYIYRKLSSALNRYPILSARTQFDIGESRIISIDLDDVTKGAGAEAKIRTSVMYMLTYHILTTHLYTGRDHLAEMEAVVGSYQQDYRPFHEKRIAALERTPKRFQMDETHRGKGVSTFMQQLVTANLEGRKWGVDIVLGSQLTNAFPEEIKELATNVTILGAGNQANIASLTEEFKLSDTMVYYLKHAMRKPGKKGATLISLIDTDEGRLSLFLFSSLGPRFLWAVNSVRSDSYVRNELERGIGIVEARELLVHRYPSGSVNEEIEIRRRRKGELSKRFENTSLITEADVENQDDIAILDDIVADNLSYFEQQKHSILQKNDGAT